MSGVCCKPGDSYRMGRCRPVNGIDYIPSADNCKPAQAQAQAPTQASASPNKEGKREGKGGNK